MGGRVCRAATVQWLSLPERHDPPGRALVLMTVPGVGHITAVGYVGAIGDPAPFRSGLDRSYPMTIPVGIDRHARPHLPTRRQAPAMIFLRGRSPCADAGEARQRVALLGLGIAQAHRVHVRHWRRRVQARRDPACDVAERTSLLGQRGSGGVGRQELPKLWQFTRKRTSIQGSAAHVAAVASAGTPSRATALRLLRPPSGGTRSETSQGSVSKLIRRRPVPCRPRRQPRPRLPSPRNWTRIRPGVGSSRL